MICLAYTTTVLTIKYVNEILKTAPGGQQLFGWSRTQLWTWKLRQNTVPLSCRHETHAGKMKYPRAQERVPSILYTTP